MNCSLITNINGEVPFKDVTKEIDPFHLLSTDDTDLRMLHRSPVKLSETNTQAKMKIGATLQVSGCNLGSKVTQL